MSDETELKVGRTYKSGSLIYEVIDIEDGLVKVSATPRPSWIAPCWIRGNHLAAIIDSALSATKEGA